MEAKGWRLFVHELFRDRLERLTERVEQLAVAHPGDYRSHPSAKLLATIRRYILEIIPQDPNSGEFRLGNTLGPDNRHWFRATFHERYRLFFRFSIKAKIIIYVWMNDDSELRKAGSKTDPYVKFKAMLERGDPPSSFDDLLKASRTLVHGKQKAQSTVRQTKKK